MPLQTQTAKEFHVKIEGIVQDTSMTYMDAVQAEDSGRG
jgi:hypothetical protein